MRSQSSNLKPVGMDWVEPAFAHMAASKIPRDKTLIRVLTDGSPVSMKRDFAGSWASILLASIEGDCPRKKGETRLTL